MNEPSVIRLFIGGNVLLLFGTLMLIYRVFKESHFLKGYSFSGATLTFLAVVTFEVAFAMSHQWWSFACGIPTVLFWGFVLFFLIFA